MDKLWTPGQKVHTIDGPAPVQLPTTPKQGGGSYFDDELETKEAHRQKFLEDTQNLIVHLRERPDHVVFVGSAETRGQLREVFNYWNQKGFLAHHPNIRIDYGVPEGGIRVGDGSNGR